MRCRFCGQMSRDGDVRCGKCDGRLHQPIAPVRSSAVPVEDIPPVIVEAQERKPAGPARQTSLFERGNLIAFPPSPSRRARKADDTTGARPPVMSRKTPAKSLSDTTMSASQERLTYGAQPRLDLLPHAPEPRRTCRLGAPVVPPLVRIKAAALDGLVVALGVAASMIPFQLLGGELVTAPKALMGFGAYAAVLALFYEAIWCVLKRESLGMAHLRIRLVNFEDGDAPGVARRWARLGALILGTLAAGLGLLWALTDPERLTWHDQISRTYPAIDNPNPGTFHRK